MARALPPTQPAEERDGFAFRSGRLALDLAATVALRLSEAPRDLLASPADLGRWLVAAGLASKNPHPSEADLEAARQLREALYHLAQVHLEGAPFAPKDRGLVNRWAAEPPPAPQLGPHGLTWTGTGVRPLLAAIARDGVELLGGSAALRLRKCARSGCAIFFVDASRSGRRRWCSMAVCGNKAKVGAFRRRQRGERPTP